MVKKQQGIGNVYHEETKYFRDRMAGGFLDWTNQPSPYKTYPDALKKFPIQPSDPEGGKPIWQVIGERRSLRDFVSRPLRFTELSQLLWATQGISLRARGYEFRVTPSAGALYPIETYIVASRVDGIPAGVYHYDVKEANVVLLREGHFGGDVNRAALGQEMLEQAGAIFIWTAMIERSKWKYRERAYRYIFMDVGHVAQNLYLAATALNLGCCTVGAFFDEEVDHILGVDGKEEFSVYMGAVGHIR